MLGGQGFPSSRQTFTTACGLRPLYNVCLASLKGKSRYCSHSVGIIFVQLHAMPGCHVLSVCRRITSANLFHVSGKGKVRLTFLRLCLIFFFKFKGGLSKSHLSIHSFACNVLPAVPLSAPVCSQTLCIRLHAHLLGHSVCIVRVHACMSHCALSIWTPTVYPLQEITVTRAKILSEKEISFMVTEQAQRQSRNAVHISSGEVTA